MLNQDLTDGMAATIAVLRERTEVMGREMRELKESNKEQLAEMKRNQRELSDKMDAVLAVMSEARGGWRTVLLIGSLAATLLAGLAWIVGFFRGHP